MQTAFLHFSISPPEIGSRFSKPAMEIRTPRLLLREYRPEDWEAVHAYSSNAEILKYEAWGPNTPVQTKAFIDAAVSQAQVVPRMYFELVVCLAAGGEVIGGIGLRLKERKKGVASMGYVFHPAHWGQGYATEAAQAMARFARTLPEVNRIFATCDRENAASQRVLERCGLEAVGMVAELEAVKGRFRDMLLYEMKL
jgi:[ribosomal protein S5]-alanine N-acetyltransferase